VSEFWTRLKPTRELVLAVILAAVVLAGLVAVVRVQRTEGPTPERTPLTVPLFLSPDDVVHGSRLVFTIDPPEVLAPLREAEGLDEVLAGADSDQEAWRRIMAWVRVQWEPGRPDPYPPADARIILRDIRSGFTGGFCAQYSFVMVQAIQSFGVPARLVTITGHEVLEAWLHDQRRWVMFDPTFELQVMDANGRTLNAMEIRRAVEAGRPVTLTEHHRAEESVDSYAGRYRRFAVWTRNDFVSRPMNFIDFDRYRVWFSPDDSTGLPAESLRTSFEVDLYPELGR
jgi:hypothetical protein